MSKKPTTNTGGARDGNRPGGGKIIGGFNGSKADTIRSQGNQPPPPPPKRTK